MAFIIDSKGVKQDVPIEASVYAEAKAAKKSVPQFLNSKYRDIDPTKGSAFAQICASEGLITAPTKDNVFGLRSPTIAEILDGTSGFNAAVNVKQSGSPLGTQSRNLFPAALIAMIEAQVAVDRETDTQMFESMVAQKLSVGGDAFEQPIVNYNVPQGPQGTQGAKHQRIAQLGETPTMLTITTSDKIRRLPTYGMGIEISAQAARAGTLDTLGLTVNRYLQVEKDQRVYQYMSSLWAGDADMVIGAIPAVTSNSLDSAASGGVLTHKAWVKFLARNRKRRRITHAACDIDTYLKIEGRVGRPGLSAYDPRLPTIDPQAKATNVTFGSDVVFFIVDSAAEGGPIPAGQVWALDAKSAITMVTNTEAEYTAIQEFILRRSEMMVLHWSQEVYRFFGDSELTPFDILQIS